MGFNDLLKKTMEIGKDLKPVLPTNYRKQFWNDFVLRTLETGEIIKENHKFVCQKNVNQTLEAGFSNIISILPSENQNVKISFTDLSGKEFSFKTKEYSFDFNDKGFMLSKIDTEGKIEKNLYVTNSLKIVENMIGFGWNKIKFILADTENVTENIFYEFIVSPENFENYISNLWGKLSETFTINFKENENEKELNNKRIKLLFDSWIEKETETSETETKVVEEQHD